MFIFECLETSFLCLDEAKVQFSIGFSAQKSPNHHHEFSKNPCIFCPYFKRQEEGANFDFLEMTFQITYLRKMCRQQSCRAPKNKLFYLFDFSSGKGGEEKEGHADMSHVWNFPQDTSSFQNQFYSVLGAVVLHSSSHARRPSWDHFWPCQMSIFYLPPSPPAWYEPKSL